MSIVKRCKKSDGTPTYRVSVYNPRTQKIAWIGTFYDEHAARQAELDAEKRLKAGGASCVFRSKPITHSARSRSLIPEQVDHLFRPQADHFWPSERNRTRHLSRRMA